MKNTISNKKAKKIKLLLDKILFLEANTASCIIMYEPKAPKELNIYRKFR